MTSEREAPGNTDPSATGAELVLSFQGWVQRVALGARPLVLGRAEDCDVVLPDARLSRRHCRVATADAGGWTIEDLGSGVGTLLGGVPVHGPTRLEAGARVQMGPVEGRMEPVPTRPPVLSGIPARDNRNIELLLRNIEGLYKTETLVGLLNGIVDDSIALAGGDRGALLLAGDGGALEAAVARDAAGRDLEPQQVLTRTLPRGAMLDGKTRVMTDAEAPEQRSAAPQSVLSDHLRSVLCVPLPGVEGPVGVLYVDGRRPAEDFGPSELAIFEALAVHGSIAIERARLREQRERQEAEARGRLESENAALRAQLGQSRPVGESEALRRTLALLQRVAASDATVCLVGETGSGKEVLARHLHELSPRREGPFVAVDCGAIPEGLIESELFGHEKGAFTGAHLAHRGLFREAERGTVFIDEIGELPVHLQTRLLRVLQEKTVQPVGSQGRVPVDARVVCATHQDLKRAVAEGRFRQDLYYRVAVLMVPVPALRERGEDIGLLAHHFLARYSALYGTGVSGFTREALAALAAHPWPGNVRELEHCVQRAALLARPPCVTRRDLALGPDEDVAAGVEEEIPFPTLGQAREAAVERAEKAYLEEALRRAGGSTTRAAELAGLTRQMVNRLIRRHAIHRHGAED